MGSLGHPSDDETGLIYMRARHYDPVTGRFISEDPAGHGSNWFAYCDNNPVNAGDADGKNPILIYILVSGIAGGIFACLSAGEWSFSNFFRGFIENAALAWATCFGPIAGAAIGLADAWLTHGNLAVGAIFGAFGGLLGGVASCVEAFQEEQMLLYLLVSTDTGFLTSGANTYVNAF